MTKQQFLLFSEPTPAATPAATCPHPPAAQFVSGNLFSGAQDLVCNDCNATLAPNWKPAIDSTT